MKRLVTAIALSVVALALATAAVAGTSTYAGPKQWSANEGAGSSYCSSWFYNFFTKQGSGYDTTVALIDNVSYGWHNTVRNTSSTTYTWWGGGQVKKGHCRANVGYFWGSCWVAT
jgi:hypothetical protein